MQTVDVRQQGKRNDELKKVEEVEGEDDRDF
jgi:hypothetical protein